MKPQNSKKITISSRKICEFIVFVFFCAVCGYWLVSCSKKAEVTENKSVEVTPDVVSTPLVEINPNADFTNFKHSNPQHERLPCAICHVRQDNSPTPKFSGHQPCSGCHVQQFADNKSTICTVCHTNAETGEMKRFPPLQDFTARFDHAQHIRQTDCKTCHQPTRGGAAFSIISRSNAHSTCFQCHQPDKKIGEKDISSCNVCHQAGNPPKAVSDTSNVYNTPFSHAKHNMNCTVCHTVKAGASRGNQVASLVVAKMHFPPSNSMSCATCHNNKRVFGGDDFSDCKRCHQGNNFKFPQTR